MDKKYEKPEVVKVVLIPDESVLMYCKTNQQFGPDIDDCYIITAQYCYDLGS